MPPRDSVGRGGWFVVAQHDEIEVVQASEKPSAATKEGERMRSVLGPYNDQAQAKKIADEMTKRTLRFMASRE